MKITRLTLQQYRCFDRLDVPLVHPVTVLVGKNAIGKTALLDALTIGVSEFAHLVGQGRAYGLEPEDIRFVSSEGPGSFEEIRQLPSSVRVSVELASGMPVIFHVGVETRGPVKLTHDGPVRAVRMRADSSESETLPVLASFGIDRALPPRGTADLRPEARPTRWSAYADVRSSFAQRDLMRDWIAQQTFVELQEGKPLVSLRAVAAAVHDCLEGASGFRYSVKTGRLEIRVGGSAHPLDRLSDGQRAIVLLVADIARRAAQLNPHLGENAARESDGVVLLDEVELHLHPAWQRQVIPSLRRAFPKMQFVVTTHSPQVVASAESGQVVVLHSTNGERRAEVVQFVEGRDSNSLLLDVFGELERPSRWREALSTLHQLIDEGELAAAHAKLAELEQRFGPNDPEVIRARWSIDVESGHDAVEGGRDSVREGRGAAGPDGMARNAERDLGERHERRPARSAGARPRIVVRLLRATHRDGARDARRALASTLDPPRPTTPLEEPRRGLLRHDLGTSTLRCVARQPAALSAPRGRRGTESAAAPSLSKRWPSERE